jgi:hypothetical protein
MCVRARLWFLGAAAHWARAPPLNGGRAQMMMVDQDNARAEENERQRMRFVPGAKVRLRLRLRRWAGCG